MLIDNELLLNYKNLLENVKKLKAIINKVDLVSDFSTKMILGEVFSKIDNSIEKIEKFNK